MEFLCPEKPSRIWLPWGPLYFLGGLFPSSPHSPVAWDRFLSRCRVYLP